MKKLLVIAILGLSALSLAGCVQMPTEKKSVSDLRPQISFVAGQEHRDAVVYLDNAQMGRVGDYLDGAAALRVLPGTHVLRVMSGGDLLLDEKFYVGDGVSRSFVIR